MYYCLLAKGFEETEAIATVDVLRRAGIDVQTVSVSASNTDRVIGSHDIMVVADLKRRQLRLNDMEGIILPGGMPGTQNLERSRFVGELVRHCDDNNLYIFAVCAAPQILGHKGLLNGKKATCYPGYEGELTGATICTEAVADGKIITGRGPGATIDFALLIVKTLKGEEVANKLRESLQCQ